MALMGKCDLIQSFQEGNLSPRTHSSLLFSQLQNLLSVSGQPVSALTGVGVNVGPGSFTGIRTSLTMARTMGQFLSCTLYRFSTFELLAAQETWRGMSVTILLNAFRQRHYAAILTVTENGETCWTVYPKVLENTHPMDVTTEVCLVDPTLLDSLGHLPATKTVLDAGTLFLPGAMVFFLQRDPERFVCKWSDLLPNYLQQPHVTLSKHHLSI